MEFGLVSFAMLLVVVLCWVDPCFGSRVLLGLFGLLPLSIYEKKRLRYG